MDRVCNEQSLSARPRPVPHQMALRPVRTVEKAIVAEANTTRSRRIAIADIEIPAKVRVHDETSVRELAASIDLNGQMHAIHVRTLHSEDGSSNKVELIAGSRRVAAAIVQNMTEIEAIVVDVDDQQARLMTIAENLDRAELPLFERADLTAERVKLLLEREAGQLARPPVGGIQPHDKGITKGAHLVNLTRESYRRLLLIAELPPNVREIAKEAGIQENQAAVLELAKPNTSGSRPEAARPRAAKKNKNRGPLLPLRDAPDTQDVDEVTQSDVIEPTPATDHTSVVPYEGIPEVLNRRSPDQVQNILMRSWEQSQFRLVFCAESLDAQERFLQSLLDRIRQPVASQEGSGP
jgi:ParB/RepB/Spo0J family partition protein